MQFPLSDKMAAMQPSAVREILKLSNEPGIIPFSAGSPASEALPLGDIQRILDEILAEDPNTALQYSVSEGYDPLRASVVKWMRDSYGVGNDDDDVIICSGAQQVMALTAQTFCNEGDVVLCETPSFVGALNSFRSFGAKLVGIPMESDGMDIQALERAMETHKNIRFLYTIPNFHNPTGITMSLEKRKEVYRLAQKHGILILEDNPYGVLRFAGEPLPAIKSMDSDGLVIYAGTFSKVVSPGIRVGYTVAPKALLPKMIIAKQCSDVHTTIMMQMLCHRFLIETDIDAYLEKISKIYSRKCALMLETMDALWGKDLSWTRPEGGMFIWCTLPERIDMVDFCTKAVKEHKTAVVPGTAFLAQPDEPCRSFRVNFSIPTDEDIRTGIARLAPLTI